MNRKSSDEHVQALIFAGMIAHQLGMKAAQWIGNSPGKSVMLPCATAAFTSPWQAIKEWIPDEEPDLDRLNRPRIPSNPDPDGFDQRPTWQPEEIQLEDDRTLVLEAI